MKEFTQAIGTVIDDVRHEGDVYRDDNPRPLGEYLVVLVAYGALVTVATALAAITGRRLPVGWRLQDLVIVSIGTHKLSRTLAKDAVTSPLRAPFTRYAGTSGPAELHEEVRQSSPMRHSLGELLTCPFCLDVWIASGFAIGLIFAPRFTHIVAGTFSAVAGADFLQLAYAIAEQAAEG